MNKYCVDLEIAEELKENGFRQETYFYHVIDFITDSTGDGYWILADKNNVLRQHISSCSAPTSDEILKELPTYLSKDNLDKSDTEYFLNISKDYYSNINKNDFYEISYNTVEGKSFNSPNNICIEDDKLSNALAKLWLYLKKEGYLK